MNLSIESLVVSLFLTQTHRCRCCSVLQCVAVCCSVYNLSIASLVVSLFVSLFVTHTQRCRCYIVLQCVAVCCSVLQCVQSQHCKSSCESLFVAQTPTEVQCVAVC